MKKNIVAIVGRTNVGKSTLYNRIIGRRVSIVDDSYGVTRDRLYHDAKWLKHTFKIIDTGGLEIKNTDSFQELIKTQVQIAIKEASVIIFVIDGRVGITNEDEYVANLLFKTKKPVLVAVNKLDNRKMDYSIYSIGFEHLFPISSIHGSGIATMLDFLVSKLDKTIIPPAKFPKLAIIGKTNAGKSSLLNALLKEKRSIVSEIAGTTRDSVFTTLKIKDKLFSLIDTAGIIKKSRLVESVDHYALIRAMDSLAESDISLIVIDVTQQFSHFDARIIGYAFEQKKPVVLIMNKWDLIKKETQTMKRHFDKIRKEFQFITWAPIVFLSALKSQRLKTLEDAILKIQENLKRDIKTIVLNEVITEIQIIKPPPSHKHGRLKISYIKQLKDTKIPTFVLFVNNPIFLHFSYKRYIENRFREYFDFEGVPINFIFKKKK